MKAKQLNLKAYEVEGKEGEKIFIVNPKKDDEVHDLASGEKPTSEEWEAICACIGKKPQKDYEPQKDCDSEK